MRSREDTCRSFVITVRFGREAGEGENAVQDRKWIAADKLACSDSESVVKKPKVPPAVGELTSPTPGPVHDLQPRSFQSVQPLNQASVHREERLARAPVIPPGNRLQLDSATSEKQAYGHLRTPELSEELHLGHGARAVRYD